MHLQSGVRGHKNLPSLKPIILGPQASDGPPGLPGPQILIMLECFSLPQRTKDATAGLSLMLPGGWGANVSFYFFPEEC